jgi:hypothetical protein
MKNDKEGDESPTDSTIRSPESLPEAVGGNARYSAQRHPMPAASDAEKYRWMRGHRGNFAIVEALEKSDKDADFDARIEAEMRMCARGF